MTDVYSTDGIAAGHRAAYWQSFVEQNFGEELEYGDSADDENFSARVEVDSVGPLCVFRTDVPFEAHTRGQRDKSRDFLLQVSLQLSGNSRLRHAGSDEVTHAGDVVVLDGSQDYDVRAEPGQSVYITVPYRANPAQLHSVRDIAGVRIDGSRGAGAVVSSFVAAFGCEAAQMPKPAAERMFQSLIETVSAAAFTQIGKANPDRNIQQRLLLRSVKLYLEDNLRDPRLSPQVIASEHGISRRQLQRLFEGQPMGLARLIWERRLARSRCDLADPLQSHRTITEIAYGWGFSSSAHFSRAFRERFGLTPTEARATVGARPD